MWVAGLGMDAQKDTVRSKMQAMQAAESTEVGDVVTNNAPRMGEYMGQASEYGEQVARYAAARFGLASRPHGLVMAYDAGHLSSVTVVVAII